MVRASPLAVINLITIAINLIITVINLIITVIKSIGILIKYIVKSEHLLGVLKHLAGGMAERYATDC